MNWYKSSQSQVSIDMSSYEESLWQWISETLERTQADDERIKNAVINTQSIIPVLQKFQYPNTMAVQQAIASGDYHHIYAHYVEMFNWYIGQTKTGRYDDFAEFRNVCKTMSDLSEQLSQKQPDYQQYGEPQAKAYFNECVKKSYQNMQMIVQNIQQSIERIGNWHNIPITVQCSVFDKENYMNPVEDGAQIVFGQGEQAPTFTYWNIDGKVEVEDLLEAGDEEFFHSAEIQSDYYNLVKELKSPGSSSKGGKVLTLFTARPVKDRHVYENASTVPSNIFLTNRADSAGGIAYDLGSTEPREVWKVRIDDRYLVKTLDSLDEKQYQVVGDAQVPVRSISLY